MKYLGIDIGGTNTKYGVINEQGEVLEHGVFPTQADQPLEVFLEKLKTQCENLDFMAIGVGCPDVNGITGELVDATNLSWPNCNLRKKIQDLFPDKQVFLDNDANVAALGEKKYGSCKNEDNFIVVTLGTGLGTGIFMDGELLRGSRGFGPEGGHFTIVPEGRMCGCGVRGHLEAYVGVRGIKTSCYELTRSELNFSEIKEKFFNGEKKFVEVIDQTAKHLAHGVATMQALFLPTKIILAGGVSSLGEDFRQRVAGYLNEFGYPPIKDLSKIELTKISLHDGAILGAGALAAALTKK